MDVNNINERKKGSKRVDSMTRQTGVREVDLSISKGPLRSPNTKKEGNNKEK